MTLLPVCEPCDQHVLLRFSVGFFWARLGKSTKAKETLLQISKTCQSCLNVKKLSSKADVALSGQVVLSERFVLLMSCEV